MVSSQGKRVQTPRFSRPDIPDHLKQRKTNFSRQMREKPTDAEHMLWSALRHHKFGLGWRRQRLLLGWIVDIWCDSLKLAIEVDGGYHTDPAQAERDAYRDSIMRKNGVRIVRVTNEQVLNDMPGLLAMLHQVTDELKRKYPKWMQQMQRWIRANKNKRRG